MNAQSNHSKDWLIEQTQGWGLPEEVTPERFDRWRRAGLLPAPHRRSLGRGLGSESVYPGHTAAQLRRLCELHFGAPGHKGEKRLPYLAWRLWWEGYDVPLARVREFMASVFGKADDQIEQLRNMSTEDREKATQRLATKRLGRKPGSLARARQHLRGESNLFMEWMFSAALGDVHDDPESRRIVEKGTGLDRARTDALLGHHLLTDDVDYMPAMGVVGALFSEPLTQQLDRLNDQELCQTRDQLQAFFEAMGVFAVFARDVAGKRGLGVGDWYAPQEPGEQACFLMFWQRLGAFASQSSVAPDPDVATSVLQSLTGPYKEVQELRKIEAFRELLSTKRVLETASDPEAERRRLSEIRRARFDHRDEVESFLRDQPDVGDAPNDSEARGT